MPAHKDKIATAQAPVSCGSFSRVVLCDECPVHQISGTGPADDGNLRDLVAIATQLRFSPRQHILSEGGRARHWFLIADGVVTLWKLLHDGRRQVTGFLTRGDFLGIQNDGCYIYSAHATTVVQICRFSWRQFESLIERLPGLRRSLLSRARHELAAAQDQMLLLGRMTAEERIASFLLKMTSRMGEGAVPVTLLPMPRLEIADYLALTPETLSRILSDWRRSEIIDLSRNRCVQIRNRRRLIQLAGRGFN